MKVSKSTYRGALLGMACGDAMGYTVDSRTWDEIKEDYGPNGLLGYDLVNGYAESTSYTQLAAFTCNGLLFGLTRGQMLGKMAPFINYAAMAGKEWAASQRAWGRPGRNFCWLLTQPEMCRRHCMDTRMLEALARDTQRYPLGTPDQPRNNYGGPGSLTAAIGAGLFFDPDRMGQEETDFLGAEVVALTHGAPMAFVSGAALAHLMSRVLCAPNASFRLLVKETLDFIRKTYGHRYSVTYGICELIANAAAYASDETIPSWRVMEKLRCESAPQVLAGAIYSVLVSGGAFDRAMIAAVNHSGRSAAVGAIAGALLGAKLGEESLPEFYMECLEPAEVLRELADDLEGGCPMVQGNRLFDLDWDRKYLHGGR